MKQIEILNCQVRLKDGKPGIIIPDAVKPSYTEMLNYCLEKKGGYVSVKIHPPRKPRTTGEKSQSHHFNGHIQQICQFIGEDFDVVKMEVKRRAIKRGYPTRETKFKKVIPISESEASTEECAILIDTAHEIADFLNLTLKES